MNRIIRQHIFNLVLAIFFQACNGEGTDFEFAQSPVSIDDATVQIVEVPTSGLDQLGNSALEFSPISVDFGSVANGTQNSDTFITVTNANTNTVYITNIEIMSSEYSVQSDTCQSGDGELENEDSCALGVRFAPTSPGTHLTSLVVYYKASPSASDTFQSILGMQGVSVSPLTFDGISSVDQLTNKSARINWTATPLASSFFVYNVTSGSQVFAESVSNTSGSVTSTTLTGLTPSTTYTFRVNAIDALGNQESNTNDVEFTTNANNLPILDSIADVTLYSDELLSTVNSNDAITGADVDQDGDEITYACVFDYVIDGSVGIGTPCTDLVNEGGGNPAFDTDLGIFSGYIPRTIDIGVSLEFKITGTDEFGGASSTLFSGTIVAGTPDAPTVTGITASPANNNSPEVSGSSLESITIKIYDDSGCSNEVASGTSDGNGDYSISVPVSDNTVTTFYATATNSIGNESDCSSTIGSSQSFTEDSAPPIFVVTGVTPDGPSSINTPTFTGISEANAGIELFDDASCSSSLGTTSADVSGNFNLGVTLTQGETVTVYGVATDAVGNATSCTEGESYTSYSIPTGVASLATSGPANVNALSEKSFEWSSSFFDANYYEHSTSTDSEQVTVKVAGHYLISVNLPTEILSGNGNVRSNTPIYVKVNGTVVPGAYSGACYNRMSSQTESSCNFMSLLPNLSVNDIITIHYFGEASTENTVEVTGLVTAYLEFIDDSSEEVFFAEATHTTNSTNLNQATAYPMSFSEVVETSDFSHDDITNPEDITINSTGTYFVSYNVPMTGAVQRASVRSFLSLNDVEVAGTEGLQGYIRNVDGHIDASTHWFGVVDITAGDILNLEVMLEANGGTITNLTGQATSLFIQKIDTASNVLSLTGTATTSGANLNVSSSYLEFDTQNYIDANFTHNVSTDSEQITIESEGDYLVLFNVAVDGDSSVRTNQIVSLELDDVQVPGSELKSFYIRSDNNHDESSGSMAFFLRDVSAGQVLKLEIEQEGVAGTVTARDPFQLTIIKKR